MSTYHDFLEERAKIDVLIEKGYHIKKVTENLNGSSVNFEKKVESSDNMRETLQIENADARKYVAALILGSTSIKSDH